MEAFELVVWHMVVKYSKLIRSQETYSCIFVVRLLEIEARNVIVGPGKFGCLVTQKAC